MTEDFFAYSQPAHDGALLFTLGIILYIFQRSLTREFTTIGISVVSVLVAIIVTHQLITFLGRAASGVVEPEAVIALIGFALLAYLPVLLALALFIAVLVALFTQLPRKRNGSVVF